MAISISDVLLLVCFYVKSDWTKGVDHRTEKLRFSLTLCKPEPTAMLGSLNNYVDKFYPFLTTLTWIFFKLNVDKNRYSLTTHPRTSSYPRSFWTTSCAPWFTSLTYLDTSHIHMAWCTLQNFLLLRCLNLIWKWRQVKNFPYQYQWGGKKKWHVHINILYR